ncbi:MAG: magnesium transporter CorA family protein [Parcubacteria group bacterium]|nr:magnesium transporter CorA family protein [Parcubacteria group bacterium]
MRSVFEKNGITWVKITEPGKGDFKFIKNLFPFHPLVIESIETPTLHPALEKYKDHLFLILHFPIIYRDQSKNKAVEVDFLITKNALVTLTYESHPQLDELFKKFQKDEEWQNELLGDNTGKLVHGIIEWLMKSLLSDLDFLEETVTDIEDRIFDEKHASIIEEISNARRDILDFRRVTAPHQTILKQLLPQVAKEFYGAEMEPYFVDLARNESKIRHLIENHKETIEALHATNESLTSNRVSKIVTLLTIFSTIILPLNFMASLWGMNHEFLPLRDGPYDFWVLLGLMLLIGSTLIFYFRYKKWL